MNPNETRYGLSQAIMIYRNADQPLGSEVPEYYIESHRVHVDREGRASLLEGRPLQRATLKRLTQSLLGKSEKTSTNGLLPKNVLGVKNYLGERTILWWTPRQKRHLLFSASLEIPSGVVECPALLFLTQGKRLSVFALRGNRRPQPKTKLMKAPFYNIFMDGTVCMGNVRLPASNAGDVATEIEHWEKAFFGSEFSHLAGQGEPLRKGKLGPAWRRLVGTDAAFPADRLMPHSQFKNLEHLMQAYSI